MYLYFSLPRELTFPNSVMVYNAREYQHGRPIYRDYRQAPHVMAPYGPLSYALPGTIGRLTDADERGLFAIGRWMSLLGTLGTLALVAALLRRHARTPRIVAGLMALVFLTAPILWPVCIAFRPDPVEMLCVVAGLALFLAFEHSPARYLAVGAFLAAFLFKQSALAGPAAVVLYLVARRRLGDAGRFALASAAAVGTAVLAMNVATGGLFHLNTVIGLRGNTTLGNLVTVALQATAVRSLVPFALATVGVVRRWTAGQVDLWTVFFATSLLVASAGTIRDGSAVNYFLEPLAVACIIGGEELARWLGRDDTGTSRPGNAAVAALAFAALAFLPLAVQAAPTVGPLLAGIRTRAARDAAEQDFNVRMAHELDALGGPALSQYNPVTLLARDVVMMDTLIFSSLADQGIFDDRPLIDMIRSGRLAALVLLFPLSDETPRYQSTAWVREAWLQAARDAGYRERRVGLLYVYTPPG
jgi:hypothetical protein